jgi:hypothetical protein
MRILAAATLALAAAALAAEAKTPAADALRRDALSACVSEEMRQQREPPELPILHPTEVCECALDDARLDPEALRPIAEGDTRALGEARADCRRQLRAERQPAETSAAAPQPGADAALAGDDGRADSSTSFLGRYWWIAAIGLAFALLVVFGRSRRQGDGVAPPAPHDQPPGDSP